eukprot:TRINITY_DN3827_c0_g1_i8.p1 TRINITY_DN3827_c0_g1~~TRINITY_DN3827_c0_g1_i8.p1  ORF type:complete len:192 (-),score=41.70 TRINITY_DN3827_c0_g1_i8:144-719(-)
MEIETESGSFAKIAESQSIIESTTYFVWRKLQCIIDLLALRCCMRWSIALALFLFFVYRAVHNGGLHVISYFLGLYMLEQFLGFISPKDELDVIAPNQSVLPTRENEDFKPFKRAVKELDLWKSYMMAFAVSIAISYIDFLNIPVYWPLLVGYFAIVMFIAFRSKIAHMLQYSYVPVDIGKRNYTKANIEA